MTSRSLIAIALAASIAGTFLRPACAQAPAAPAQLVPGQSEIVFTIRQMGVPVEGRFGRFTATIALDPRQPQSGSVAVAIDTSSARFGSAELDAEVGKPAWLASARFPQATFRSTSIKPAGPGRFDVAGTLTLKGASQDVVVPVQLARSGGTGTATGGFTIKRLAFRVGEGEWADTSLVADDVVVHFKLALSGLPPP